MEDDDDLSSFWVKPNEYNFRRRRTSSGILSVIGNSRLLLIVILVVGVVGVALIIPVLLNLGSKVFRPQMIRKSWDSLNLLLVLFAIICGFVARNGSIQRSSSIYRRHDAPKTYPTTPQRWSEGNYGNSLSRLRSFRSNPDLTQESLWMSSDKERMRFYDDTRFSNSKINQIGRWLDGEFSSRQYKELDDTKGGSSTFEDVASEASSSLRSEANDSSARKPSSRPKTKRKPKKSSHVVGEDNLSVGFELDAQVTEFVAPNLLLSHSRPHSQQLPKEKRSGTPLEEAKTMQQTEDIPEDLPSSTRSAQSPTIVAHNHSSSKKAKSKSSIKTGQQLVIATHKSKQDNDIDGIALASDFFSDKESSWVPIPPPPPPPSKNPVWRWIRAGDFVKLASINSSQGGSPLLESDFSSDKEFPNSGEETSSPDVNTKAGNFIAQERADRALEMMLNPAKGTSPLRPDYDDTYRETSS